ncbi:ABC transporter permease [Virgibacillus xinjiangensis]|uniref:ABC transporter permease n=1 Tax=Virgibacillus xinjiangensis TaxID=393090 RepID=A0ABV7CYY1_9BACI
MVGTLFTGAGSLFSIGLKRERIRIPLWMAGITFFTLLVPGAFTELYPSQNDRMGIAETMRNPAMTALIGPGNLDNYTIGAMTVHQMLLFTALTVAFMNILLMSRHTRGDEEEGREEMLRALPVGRLSHLQASFMLALVTNLLLALIIGVGLYALRIEGMFLEGSLLYGTALGGIGLFFAGVTAISAQLVETSRGTAGLTIAVLLFSYLARGMTDINDQTWSWFSPLGWVTKTEAYTSNNWGPVLLMAIAACLLLVAAYYLNAKRDIGTGLLPSKPGRAHASWALSSPVGLSLRLQRTGMAAWGVGLLVMGLSYGSVLGDLEGFFEGNELLQQMLDEDDRLTIVEQFLPVLMVVVAILSSIPPLLSMLKLTGEERKGRVGHLLGRQISRQKLMASYLMVAAVNAFVMLSLAVIGLWVAGNAVMEEGLSFWFLYGAGMAYYPAFLVMLGLTMLLIGVLPNYTKLVWLYLAYSFMIVYWGGLFDLSDWAGKLSPYGHVPQVPIDEWTVLPVIVLIVCAVILAVGGFIGYAKRDIDAG